jgi:hypothetical protein
MRSVGPRCSQCGADSYAQHPILGHLCYWHQRLATTFRGRA